MKKRENTYQKFEKRYHDLADCMTASELQYFVYLIEELLHFEHQ